MRIFLQYSFAYAVILLGLVELASATLVFREYLKRRQQNHLLFLFIYFLILGFGNLITYFGDFFAVNGYPWFGPFTAELFLLMLIVGTIFYGFVFVNLYIKKFAKVWYASLLFLGVIFLIIGVGNVGKSLGYTVPVSNDFLENSLSYGFWFIVNIVTLVLVGRQYYLHKKNKNIETVADKMILIGSILIILGGIMIGLISEYWFEAGACLIYLVMLLSVIFTYIGVIAKKHPNQEVVKNPWKVLTGHLSHKVLLIAGIFYVALTAIVLVLVTHFFVVNFEKEYLAGMKMGVQSLNQTHAELSQSVGVMAESIAIREQTNLALNGNREAMDAITASISDSTYEVFLVNMDGDVVASSVDDFNDEIYEGFKQFLLTIDNQTIVNTKRIGYPDHWSIVAITPVRNNENKFLGAVVVAKLVPNYLFAYCTGENGLSFSGCGIISSQSEEIMAVGSFLDSVTFLRFNQQIKKGILVGSDRENGIMSYALSGAPEGETFYAYLLSDDFDSMMYQIVSLAVMITVMFMLISMILLLYGIGYLMRPLYQLKKGTLDLVNGEYGKNIDIETSDEIGDLTKVFNKMSQVIKERTDSLEENVQMQRDFLSHTAHEIRTPLNIFRWSLEMLRYGEVGSLNKEQQELLEQMDQTNDRIRRLVNELLEVSRIERGVIKYNKKKDRIEEIIDEVAGGLSVGMREKNIDFYWKQPDKPLPEVVVDRDAMISVLTNLLGNAIKFTNKDGQVSIDLFVEQNSGPTGISGDFIKVVVKDNGIGIPKKEQENIFRRFFRASNVVAKEIEGTGLGMYISSEYVKAHGGEMWFTSKEGHGTTFYFTIPTGSNE